MTIRRNPAFLNDVTAELERAESGHRPLNSLHEAYAVILEELDELWEHARLKREARDPAKIRTELVQVAAMAWRAARDLGLEPDPEWNPDDRWIDPTAK